jgi:hypothetical protein
MTQGHFIALFFPIGALIAVALTAAIAKAIWIDRRYPEEVERFRSEPRHRPF